MKPKRSSSSALVRRIDKAAAANTDERLATMISAGLSSTGSYDPTKHQLPVRGRHNRHVDSQALAEQVISKRAAQEIADLKAQHTRDAAQEIADLTAQHTRDARSLRAELEDQLKCAIDSLVVDWDKERVQWAAENLRLVTENDTLRAHVDALENAAANQNGRELYDRAVRIMQEDGDLNTAQAAFAKAWKHRSCSPRAKMTDLQKDLAILALFEMNRQSYDTFRVFLALPTFDHAKVLRGKHPDYVEYSVGNIREAWELGTRRFHQQCTVVSSDGTRWIRFVDLLRKQGLVGRGFPPDIRDWPVGPDPVPPGYEGIAEYVRLCRGDPTLLSHELLTVALHAVTGQAACFLPVMVVPEPVSGFDAYAHTLLMMQCAKFVWENNIQCCGDCTDSCSTGHCAGLELMTPRVGKKVDFWLGVDIPGFRYWSPLVALGECGGVMTEFWWSWYGETPHTERNLRKGPGRPKNNFVTQIFADNTQHRAMLDELRFVEEILKGADPEFKYTGASLKGMRTIKAFRDQEGDSAKELLKMTTMEAMVMTRKDASYPLLLYILAGHYLFEVFNNPSFTHPYLIAVYVWTAKLLLDKLEAYVEFKKLPKDICLLSDTTRRTMDSMAHTALHHVLKMFRKGQNGAIQLGVSWPGVSLARVNTKPMEGYHGTQRTQGTDINMTPGEWILKMSDMVMKQNILNRLSANYKVDVGAPRNVQKENKGRFRTFAMEQPPKCLQGLIGIAASVLPAYISYGNRCD